MMSARTRIKICGLRRPQDLQQAIDLGVDSVGLVFCSKSPRHLELDQAAELMPLIPAFVSAVALFLDPDADYVEQVLNRVKPDVLQFHGQESRDFCEQFGRRYVKAVAMQQQGDPLEQARKEYPAASGYLVDSHEPGGMGGRGKAFDWSRLGESQSSLILAGGLNPDNVQTAVEQVRPWAVDVSSGVEDSPGCKSAAKMAGFVAAVRAADGGRTTTIGN